MADNPIGSIRRKVFEEVGKHVSWWELPLPAQLAALAGFRDDLRQFNLYDTETPEPNGDGDGAVATAAPPPPYRTYDGSHTDPEQPGHGQDRDALRPQRAAGDDVSAAAVDARPEPTRSLDDLLNRDSFKPATTLNVLAACWLQFQNHDWFSHGDNSETEFIEVPLAPGDEWDDGVMEVRRTSPGLDQRGRRSPADVRQQGHPVVGRLAAVRLDRGAQPRAPRRRGREAEDGRRPAARGERQRAARRRPDRVQRQLVGRAGGHAHAVRARAQRDLRHAQRPLPDVGRRAAVPQGAADQRGADREDPHGRVDARDPQHEGAPDRDERQLVRRAAEVGQEDVRPHRLRRADLRDRRVAARPPRRALLDHQRVRLRVPDAPADP